jgi:hypothetical protein
MGGGYPTRTGVASDDCAFCAIRRYTLAVAGESRLYAESWPAIYFDPLIGALEWVGRDDMGREAIQSQLKKVILQNTKACSRPECWAAFHDGVLTLDHESVSNAYDVDNRKKALIPSSTRPCNRAVLRSPLSKLPFRRG